MSNSGTTYWWRHHPRAKRHASMTPRRCTMTSCRRRRRTTTSRRSLFSIRNILPGIHESRFFFLSRLQLRGHWAFVQVQRGTGSKPGATWLIIDERDWRNKNQVLSLLILSIGCGTSNKWYQQLEKKYLVTTLKLFNVHWHKKNNNKNWLLGQRLFKFWFIPARG